jgi:hypothetical protein
MRKFFVIGYFVLLAIGSAEAKVFENLSLGISGGYTNYRTLTPEFFVQKNLILFKRPFEPKVGINFRTFDRTSKEDDRMGTNSIGLFAEATIFPFHNYFFAGIRWELVTINWFAKDALQKSESTMFSSVFSGTNFYGIVGVDIPISKRVGFRLYGMSGIQQYKLSDGVFSSGNYAVNGPIQESHVKFVYQLNGGIVVHLK